MNNFKKISLSIGVLLLIAFTTSAQDAIPVSVTSEVSDEISAFKNLKQIPRQNISIPTVIEIPVTPSETERNDFAVLNTTMDKFVPHHFNQKYSKSPAVQKITSNGNRADDYKMNDQKSNTFAEFPASLDVSFNTATITIETPSNLTASSLTLQLDNYVALPNTVQITAISNGTSKVVVTEKRFNSTSIRFPETTATSWSITLKYIQPLRISEIKLIEEGVDSAVTQGVRFLAQPDNDYVLYMNSDRYVRINIGESANLRDNEGVVRIPLQKIETNQAYVQADVDGDGIPDARDNCVHIANADQVDVNNNNRGDACDDFDKDGRINSQDNCINHPNARQADEDGDGIGDVCDDEESRLTEKYAWIPWVGMGFAAVVILILFITTIISMRKEKEVGNIENTSNEGETDENVNDSGEIKE